MAISGFRHKKTITGKKGSKITQLSKNSRHCVKPTKLYLSKIEHKLLISKFKRLLKRAHPDWSKTKVDSKSIKVLTRNK